MKQLVITLLAALLVACATSTFTPKEFTTHLQLQGPHQTLKQLSPTEWQTLIAGVSKGNKAWLDLVPQFARCIYYLKDWQKSKELSKALAFALVNNPADTLTMMQPIDRRIEAMGDYNASLVDFGSMMACTVPLITEYDKASNLRYNHLLSTRLKKIGKLGEECLKSLNETMAEVERDEKFGGMKWRGTKSWYP